MSEQIDFGKLCDLIVTHFNDDELRTLCFNLDIDYENLGGEGKTGKVRELVLHQRRHNRIQELVNEINRQRPGIMPQDKSVDSATSGHSAVTSKRTEISNDDSPDSKNGGQPLPPLTYVLISAVALLISIGLLLFMVFFGPRLLRQGMNQQVFYFLLIPLGLSTAAFVFGGMRSYAAVFQIGSWGKLTATGPIVAAMLVVLGGFYLVPTENSFDVTVRVNTPDGPLREGDVVLIVGASTLRQPIDSNGEADFKSLSISLIESPVRISVWNVDDTRIAEVESLITGDVIEINVNSPPPTPLPPTPTPTPLPEQSFNIAVAEFSMLDSAGEMSQTPISQEFSAWLFNFIDSEARKLSAPLSFQTRGPDDIGAINGKDAKSREMNAAAVAKQHNATILIYGLIEEENELNIPYSVALEFYVSDEAFDYGSEVAGPDHLGQPVTFTLPLEDNDQRAINESLYARAMALKYIVEGLSNFYFGRYELAAASFNWAATKIQGWSEDEGKEVAFLLEGAAWLRAYDPCTAADLLPRAQEAFEKAHRLNDEYARNYLGLAAAGVEEAIQYVDCKIVSVDESKLITAEGFYSESLSLDRPNQSESAYVPIKANYGLGQIYLLKFEHGPSEEGGARWQQTWNAFEDVIQAYDDSGQPTDLAWFAAGAHAQLGLLAGHKGDWETMIDESSQAIEILDSLPDDSVRNWIARYWSWIGLAETRRMRPELARRAYEQAIEIGTGYVSKDELEDWQNKLDSLEE